MTATEGTSSYLWSDAWLLSAIAFASKEKAASLKEIVAMADALNHAMMTLEEFESGLCRLTNGGWITEQEGKFSVTEQFRKVGLKSVAMENTKHLLNVEPWQPKQLLPHPSNNFKYPGFTRERLAEAEREYQKEFSKQFKKK